MNFDNLLNRLRKIEEAEGKKPDFLDVDKDGDKTEPMAKAAKEKEESKKDESLEEAMIVQADGNEAMALLGILKLAGMPAPAPVVAATEERDIEHANTPDERVEPMSAAVPSGNDLHKSKTMVPHGYQQGDNPHAMEGLEQKLQALLADMIAEDSK